MRCAKVIAVVLVAGLATPALARPPAHAKGGGETFGSQVRVLAHEQHEADAAPGLGQTVSKMAHERNAARADAREADALAEPPKGKPRGRR